MSVQDFYQTAQEIVTKLRDHTVPIETPQSMLDEPSSGSNTTQYLPPILVQSIIHTDSLVESLNNLHKALSTKQN